MSDTNKQFWRGFWEGVNPAWWLAWTLYGLGHLISLPMSRWDAFAWLYPAYNFLMQASVSVQDRFRLSGPWGRVGERNA